MSKAALLAYLARPIVAQTDASRLAQQTCEPLPVGMLRWAQEDRVTLLVKASYTFDPQLAEQTLALAREQAPFTLSQPSEQQAAAPNELATPADYVAAKQQVDVLLLGEAHAAAATPRIDAQLRVSGCCERVFTAVGVARPSMPLVAGFLRDRHGDAPTEPVGPCGPEVVEDEERLLAALPDDEAAPDAATADPEEAAADEDSADPLAEDPLYWDLLLHAGEPDLARGVQFAAAAQRGDALASDATIELVGLSPGGARQQIQLPGHVPKVVVDLQEISYYVEMLCDTLLIDSNAGRVSLVWRGQVPNALREVLPMQVTVSLERDGEAGWRPLAHIYRDLQRGHFYRIAQEQDLRHPAPQPDEDLELEMLRYRTFGRRPEPTLALPAYTAIVAELEQSEDRAAALRVHALTEDSWLLEERGWIERVAEAAARGDAEFAATYDAALRAARAATATRGDGAGGDDAGGNDAGGNTA